ncbi:MAG: DNA translocase FtsK 4TM domain-containing protein [Desulfomonile tiedjei]|uniref:DNA translocase FtsK 4TM domain-containing protein n=1 Tax=Desulfomonile tiedjei TaxID=2358 RepID=A0A9D6Z5G3_9BACT|nr:DNA translocase FtsK 4TM domain-containing protein [Desulfomonile tiedjei]
MARKSTEKQDLLKMIPETPQSPLSSHKRDCFAVIVFAAAVFLLLCLVSYDPRDPSFNVATARPKAANLCGLLGSHVADALVQILGMCAFIVPAGLVFWSIGLFRSHGARFTWADFLSTLLLLSGLSCLLDRFRVGAFLKFPTEHPAGALGSFLHSSFYKFLGSGGEILLALTLVILCVLHFLNVSPKSMARLVRPGLGRAFGVAMEATDSICEHFKTLRASRRLVKTPVGISRIEKPIAVSIEKPEGLSFPREVLPAHSWEQIPLKPMVAKESCDEDAGTGQCSIADTGAESEKNRRKPVIWKPVAPNERRSGVTQKEMEKAIEDYLSELSPGQVKASPLAKPAPVCDEEKDCADPPRPIKVTRRADEDIAQPAGAPNIESPDDYVLPSLDLLDRPPTSTRSIDEKLLEENAAVLEQKLANLGVRGQVVEIHPGPVITMYELSLEPGIPLRRVLNMADDLAMALKSGSTRIVAPIPGKDTVGIEVPNLNREIVYFREIIESPAFMDSQAALKVALGKGIDGEPFATSLARMPHLLIAGATGTGKSVGLNCLICSWLMSCHPDDLKFIMVDPKRLELSYYQDVPHLLHPVVTEAEKVPKVLSWAIREMERRYELLSKSGSKNIESYNEKVKSGELLAEPDGSAPRKLPFIIIIVDELAELMMVAAKDIEISIARLAQMARASGIHLILATQRPSVDVITGVIKANFPARLSFQVSAKPDSRTILDTVGAENLLGIGDMLFLPPGAAKLTRLHGAFLSEKEIRRIVDSIKAQRPPVYLKEISAHVANEESSGASSELIDDEKYDEAVQLVTRLGHASISLIQRHMRIGYNRAARIIEAMEAEGIIGPSDGTSRPREVLARSLESIPDR